MEDRGIRFTFDFMPIGQEIKKNRESEKMTREQLAEIVGYAPRHIQAIENEGQYPSFSLFVQLVTMFDVAVDRFFFPEKSTKSSVRLKVDALLDEMSENGLQVILAAAVKGFSITASKIGLLSGCIYLLPENEVKTSDIDGTAVTFGYRSMPYGPYDPDTHEPSGYYDMYVAEFEYDGIEYQLVAEQMEAEEVVKVVSSIIVDK